MKTQILAKSTQVIAFATPSALSIPEKSDSPMPDAIVWMPAGRHAISAGTMDGPAYQGTIICDEQASRAVAASFAQITATGQRVWIDFDHEDADASAWVKSFSWDPSRGILAHLDWTAKGESAVRGKSYYSFSPAFEAEGRTGRVVGLIAGHAAGGLVNAPAFGAAMPALIAARMSGATTNKNASGVNPELSNMKDLLVKLLAALAITAPADASEEQLVALVAKNTADAHKSNAEAAKLVGEINTLRDSLRKSEETAAVQAKKSQEDRDATSKELSEIKALQAASGSRSATGAVVTSEDLIDVLATYASKDPAQLPAQERFHVQRDDLARERAKIWARDIKPFVNKESLHELALLTEGRKSDITRVAAKRSSGELSRIFAANSLGTLSGSLIMQQSLSLLKAQLPGLSLFTTDFSSEGAKLNQSIITRLRGLPTVGTYNTTTGYAATDVSATDVPVSINLHRYTQFNYNANEIASTNRDLFGEQSEGAVYVLGKDMLDATLGLFTLTNYALTAQKSIVAQGSWNRAAIINQRVALRKRKVQIKGGFAIMNEDYFGQLTQDSTIVNLAVYQKPEIISEYVLPMVAGFQPVGYVDLPTTSNLTAIMGAKESAIIAARLPYDYVDAQAGANFGTVSQISDPNTGLSLMLTQYVSHDLGRSIYRVALMYGVAVGDPVRAQLVVSA